MPYCLNPTCSSPKNPDGTNFCQSCGNPLIPLQDRYQIIDRLGQGGFGITYLAEDVAKFNTPCVVKQLFPSWRLQNCPEQLAKAKELFQREAYQLHRLRTHPQIPDLQAHFEEKDSLYIVQEFIQGQDLLKELKQGAFSEAKVEAVLRDLLPVLEFIHQNNVIHRDIKPENIMRRQKDGKLVLIDFGISRSIDTIVTGEVTAAGTEGYMPPEQRRGIKVFPASDLYSLGATCIHLLTNQHPGKLHDLSERLIWRNLLDQAGRSIHEPLGQVLDTLIQRSVQDRFQSADQALQALEGNLSIEISETLGDHYHRLVEDLLRMGKYKEADQKTAEWMTVAEAQRKGSSLNITDIDHFPSHDLRNIDRLWVKYSQGRFGFSIQKKIWQECGSPVDNDLGWGIFLDRVGWRMKNRGSLFPKSMEFDTSAPEGFLPLGLYWTRTNFGTAIKAQFYRYSGSFFSRVGACKL